MQHRSIGRSWLKKKLLIPAAVVAAMAGAIIASPPEPRLRCRSRWPAWTAAATTSPTPPGAGPAARTCGSGQPLRRRHRLAVGGPERPQRQQPDLQRREPERLLRAPRHPVGLRVGSVPRPHLRPAGGRPAPRRPPPTSRSTRPTRWRRSPTTSASSRSTGRRRRPGPVRARRTRASRPTPRTATSTRTPCTAAPTPGWTGCAPARWTATRPTTRPT